ncbi:uncharacterized protein LOC129794533 [Lutzomyia longipalpis]|uniref:uncharacterized protein LOC129794533 n=1 Tax=Lutzomyia longipalpis TaxID=7200 RepID=UPI0024839307|nr:uncharacterized protein LOC129794533 [Lutzomyia longipalpis]
MIADIEEVVDMVEEKERADELRARLVNVLQNGVKRPKNFSASERAFVAWEKETKDFLKENGKEITVVCADKGNKTVIMDRSAYEDKMKALVGDQDSYKLLNRDPTQKYQRMVNELVRDLYDKNVIDFEEKMRISISNAIPPRMYGLPKIHKEGTPMRPVVSSIGSPTYALAKFAAQQLSPLSVNQYNLRNSEELVSFLKDRRAPEDHVLISLDVVSLFTNVPIRLILEEVERRYVELEGHTFLARRDLMKVVQLCLTSGYFAYGGQCYAQVDGVAMGSPISPIVADIAMQRVLDVVLEGSALRVDFLKKYVDDLLVCIHKDDVREVLEVFNAPFPKIQFTLEEEINGAIPYLDVKISRESDQTFSTVWYAKPTSSLRMLNYNSGHPRNMIMNVGRGFVRRVRRLTSKPDVNINGRISSILKLNDFPEAMIKSLLRPEKETHVEGGNIGEDASPPVYRSMNYVKGISERMRKIIGKATDAKLAFSTQHQNRQFFTRLKDPIQEGMRSNVVYEVCCKDCPVKYIGTTKQYIKRRMLQHNSDCKPPIRNKEVSALCTHVANTGHTFDLKEPKILDAHKHYRKRMMLEMLHIRKNMDSVVNKRSDVEQR